MLVIKWWVKPLSEERGQTLLPPLFSYLTTNYKPNQIFVVILYFCGAKLAHYFESRWYFFCKIWHNIGESVFFCTFWQFFFHFSTFSISISPLFLIIIYMNNVETQLIVNSTLLMSKNAKWRVGIYTTLHFSYSSY